MSTQNIMYTCLGCQLNTFPFLDKSKSDVSLINYGFNNFRYSSDTNIFPAFQSVTPWKLLLMILIILSL